INFSYVFFYFFFFQAEDGIRDFHVTGVQTCALPISSPAPPRFLLPKIPFRLSCSLRSASSRSGGPCLPPRLPPPRLPPLPQGSWLFELLPPPGSFHAIAFSVI